VIFPQLLRFLSFDNSIIRSVSYDGREIQKIIMPIR
jgi:hypothetical protein